METLQLFVGVIALALIGLFIYSYVIHRPWDPYARFYTVYFYWAKCFAGKTYDNEEIFYYLEVLLKKVDPQAFKEARMLEDEARDKFVAEFHRNFFIPFFEKKLLFGYSYSGEPALCYKPESEDQTLVDSFPWVQATGCPLRYPFSANLDFPTESFQLNGCQVFSVSLSFQLKPSLLALTSGEPPEPAIFHEIIQ